MLFETNKQKNQTIPKWKGQKDPFGLPCWFKWATDPWVGLEYLSGLYNSEIYCEKILSFQLWTERETVSQALLSVWDSKVFASGTENVPPVQQLSRTQCDSDTFDATVLAGQAEMAFPSWLVLHSENDSFLTVLWMQSGAEHFHAKDIINKVYS